MIKILILNGSHITPDIFIQKGVPVDVTYKEVSWIPPMRQNGTFLDGSPKWTPSALEYARNECKPLEYTFIYYCYKPSDYPQNGTTGGFTEVDPVYLGTTLATIRLDGHEQEYFNHESMHLMAKHLFKLGYPIVDQMDIQVITEAQLNAYLPLVPPGISTNYKFLGNGKVQIEYYKNFIHMDDPDSNFSITWNTIKPFVSHLEEKPPVLKLGMKNGWVREYQYLLNLQGYWYIPQTGYYFILTEKATRDFQTKSHLTADGVAYVKTFEAISPKKKL